MVILDRYIVCVADLYVCTFVKRTHLFFLKSPMTSAVLIRPIHSLNIMARLSGWNSSSNSKQQQKKKKKHPPTRQRHIFLVPRRGRLLRILSISLGGLAMVVLLVVFLFSIVSMKASHQLMMLGGRRRGRDNVESSLSSSSSSTASRLLPGRSNTTDQNSKPLSSSSLVSSTNASMIVKMTTTTTTTNTTTNNKTIITTTTKTTAKKKNGAADHHNNKNQTKTTIVSTAVIEMCSRTLWHTLETTTIVLPYHETFVHTGDIDDLWLRDSAAQVHPLLLPLVPKKQVVKVDPAERGGGVDRDEAEEDDATTVSYVALIYDDANLDRVVSGLIRRHALYIRHDPYANAFRIDDSYVFSAAQKLMGRHDLISTWNYELDSGCYTIRLLYHYWRAARDPDVVLTANPAVREAVSMMIDLWIAEQRHEEDAYPTGDLFDCLNCHKPYRYPGLAREGKGRPTNATSGLTWTGFRPSDDECTYHFLIPANMMCVTVLDYVLEMALELWHDDDDLIVRARTLQRGILRGIQEHGTVHHPKYGHIYAYEVDGLGNYLLMDDANVPSLLSLPYLQYPYLDHEIYANTKRFLLSTDNPTYASGTNPLTGPIAGLGSPHMADRIRHNIWPMALAMDGLITKNPQVAEQLVLAAGTTGWMHESFDVNNPNRYTRSWFCWADALFAELALTLLRETDSVSLCLDRQKYHILAWRDPVPPVPSHRMAAVA
jgi:uncharacterized protein